MQKILLLEDDLNLNRGIALLLSREGYEVRQVYTIKEAKEAFQKGDYALVISDITLPDGTGLDFGRMVRAGGDTYLIYLTALDQERDIVNGYDTGADDYITKPFNILEVKARMKAILRRNSSMEKKAPKSNVITAGDMKIDCDSRNLYIAGKEINLTAKEFDLLEMLAVNPGKVYSRDNLLKAVWGQDYSGDGRTVDVHMRRLREKIEDNPSEPKYVHTKWGVGYYFNV